MSVETFSTAAAEYDRKKAPRLPGAHEWDYRFELPGYVMFYNGHVVLQDGTSARVWSSPSGLTVMARVKDGRLHVTATIRNHYPRWSELRDVCRVFFGEVPCSIPVQESGRDGAGHYTVHLWQRDPLPTGGDGVPAEDPA